MTVRVWAPNGEAVEVELEAGREPLTRSADGWWDLGRELEAGTDYAFVVDGNGPFPDPRSPWQPHGVHGPSRTFDSAAHRWQDSAWAGRDARGALLYELHVGTFTTEGTFDAAMERLAYLRDLGVQMIQLMPVAAFPGQHGWGYDGVALFAVHDAYGGPAALQRFVDAAHRHQIAVSLDVVYNHLGPSGNYLGVYGPYFTDTHSTPWGDAVNLDGPGSGQVRQFIIDNAVRWLRDFHLDALRLDAVHALIDASPRHVLAELADAVAHLAEEVGRPLSLIAESDLNDVRMVTATAAGGLGMTAQWADDVHHAIHAYVTGERHGYYVDFGSPGALVKALERVFVHDGGYSTFRGQDWGAPVPQDADGHRFVVFTSNHDQVGNRGRGDRPAATLSDAKVASAAALLLTGPGTPMLFMGEEWAASTPWFYFTDHAEPELAEAIRTGRAREFAEHGWEAIYGAGVEAPDPQDPGTVAASILRWDEREHGRHRALGDFYRELMRLRREVPDLSSGDRRHTRVTATPDWVRMQRGDVTVAVNVTSEPQRIPMPGANALAVLLAWEAPSERDAGGLVLPPGAAVLGQDATSAHST
ncbi:malto-oligosyltrehalose trehalohydrolase [Ruania halotolerans]|uniref:malto-oligosyltrehalose trehalohydrolase n=1 Tax=Ruania halotolerans TaxID=2897773 RepID=UPI001E57DAEA|nr:malto-oligosyltrehalose trehalohydrolase [Ruania halotolerans]UFU04783.1 malto-oligosyltrehalose trehalohydrolase [Ruania halotolerans]